MNEAAGTILDNQLEGNKNTRGELKIFLGYCAGVGKTYRMLQEGITNYHNGVDVVIGIVEGHGRTDTEALASKLEILPRKNIKYANLAITEMDLDRILERHPQIVLVDELAHTNAPGSRHAKRYQDVEELLNAGINVYTTLNIQHVQSLVDVVYQITNIRIEEIIPNWLLDSANEIELVDLSPEKLQQRMHEGKVYIPQKAKLAMQRFFKMGNLLALRELSLKYTAKHVDTDLATYREREEIAEVWPVETKFLVGISSRKNTEHVLLMAHRFAKELEAEWYAVHVESLQQVHYSEKAHQQLHHNLTLAEELGAKVVTLSGKDIAEEVISFAKEKNVTMIVTGVSQRSRLQEFFRGSVLDNLVKKASPINVLVVGGEAAKEETEPQISSKKSDLKPYLIGSAWVTLLFILNWFFPKLIVSDNLLMILLLPPLLIGILSGISVGLFTSILSLLMYDFWCIPPTSSFAISDLRLLPNILIFLLIVSGVSWVARMIHWRAESAKYRERFIHALYNFSREILSAESQSEILTRAMHSMNEAFASEVITLLPTGMHGELEEHSLNPQLKLSDMEKAVAIWVFKNSRPAGHGTSTLASAKWYYLPLKTHNKILGVICLINNSARQELFSPEQKRLLDAFAGIVALALTKIKA